MIKALCIKAIFGILGNEDEAMYDSKVNSIFSLHFDTKKSSNKNKMVSFDSYRGYSSFRSSDVKNKYIMTCKTFSPLKSDDLDAVLY